MSSVLTDHSARRRRSPGRHRRHENSRLGIPVIFHEECLHGHAAPGRTSSATHCSGRNLQSRVGGVAVHLAFFAAAACLFVYPITREMNRKIANELIERRKVFAPYTAS
jgi:hypothetical protein